MKPLRCVLLALSLCASLVLTHALADSDTSPSSTSQDAHEDDSNVYIVEFEHEASLQSVEGNDRTQQVVDAPHIAFESFVAEHLKSDYAIRFRFTDPRLLLATSIRVGSASKAAVLRTFPGVKNVYRALPVSLTASIPPTASGQKRSEPAFFDDYPAHRMIGLDKLFAQGYRGKGQTVALVDSGIDYKHHALNGGQPDGVPCFGPGCPIRGGSAILRHGNDTLSFESDVYDACNSHGTTTGGMIIANAPDRNFTGAAPEASLLVYKVVSCEKLPMDDQIAMAFTRAFHDGADIISISLARTAGWAADSVQSVMADRLSQLGVPIVAGPNNFGTDGLFLGQTPASAPGATTVGSVAASAIPSYTFKVITANGTAIPMSYISTSPIALNSTTKFPAYATAKEINKLRDACDPLPDSTPDLSPYAVFVGDRDDCYFSTKVENVLAKGAKLVLIYNADNGAALSYNANYSAGTQVVSMFQRDGAVIVDLLSKGEALSIDFGGSQYVQAPDVDWGGYVVESSGLGPSWELRGGVSMLTVGSNVLSTTNLKYGSYELEDGVSYAIPMLAGLYAVYKSIKGNDQSVDELRSIFASTAKVQTVNASTSMLASVIAQGGGLANVFNAVSAVTRITPDVLYLNDTEHFNGNQSLTIKNVGSAKQAFQVSHLPAGTLHTFVDSSQAAYQVGHIYPVNGEQASATIEPSSFELEPGQSQIVDVTIRPPQDDQIHLPVYSGFINISSSADFGSVHAQYFGVAGKMNALPIINRTGVPALFDSTGQTASGAEPVFLINSTDAGPKLRYKFLAGTAYAALDLVHANFTLENAAVSPSSPASSPFPPVLVGQIAQVDFVEWAGRDLPEIAGWTSQLGAQWNDTQGVAHQLEDGHYRFLLRALKIFGKREEVDAWETWLSDPFTVKVNVTAA
ncbi:hypothetical protein OC842_007149 [Tilletia horrida]|uniref:Peptidase S8/S53 domain-containing protein n=1 Tax=Tilletia horrida TaxID=155126 RepID=A0AAN6G790_9BASI|nr:hypothetical protein OC842_007149 [Tilletia horrida]